MSSAFGPVALEQEIGRLLKLAGMTILSTPAELARVDYVYMDKSGKRVAIAVKGGGFEDDSHHFAQLETAVEPIRNGISKLILVTSDKPNETRLKTFAEYFKGTSNTADWLSAEEFAEFLGAEDSVSPTQPPSQPNLRIYQARAWSAEQSDLARQLSGTAIRKMQGSRSSSEALLRIGERVSVVVVQSDIKNFSVVVKAAKPNDLNSAMAKYYRLARALAWSYGGVLDKFIGDAVLAIFNYPWSEEDAPVKATRFASDLIEIGKPIFGGLMDLINESIDTGTRIGISTGEVSVLNIGLRGLELSFVGDVLNLAARLERESDVDSFLVDNITKGAISRYDNQFFQRLGLVKKELSPERVKGQLTSIQAWQAPRSVIPAISNLQRDLTVEL